jgi:hypothetical protein
MTGQRPVFTTYVALCGAIKRLRGRTAPTEYGPHILARLPLRRPAAR